ncbi:hypothetical protein ABW19_dt0202335 [Dactylella cylindrospora]|nr:hypothetical protein ABW19_dt0202335 [Dactylella cylindrospora]
MPKPPNAKAKRIIDSSARFLLDPDDGTKEVILALLLFLPFGQGRVEIDTDDEEEHMWMSVSVGNGSAVKPDFPAALAAAERGQPAVYFGCRGGVVFVDGCGVFVRLLQVNLTSSSTTLAGWRSPPCRCRQDESNCPTPVSSSDSLIP